MTKRRIVTIVLSVLAIVCAFCLAACGGDDAGGDSSGGHTHTYDEAVWEKDGTGHWHPATCGHTSEKGGFSQHEWDEGSFNPAPTATNPGVKIFTCEVCGYAKTETVEPLGAGANSVSIDLSALSNGVSYDKTEHGIDKTAVTQDGTGEITIEYKLKGAGDETYSAQKPIKAGTWVVRVKTAATAEYKEGVATAEFTINPKELALQGTFTKVYDGNAEIQGAVTKGIYSGDSVTAKITMTSADVSATVSAVSLEGTDGANYKIISYSAATIKIEQFDLVVPETETFAKEYDATGLFAKEFSVTDGIPDDDITLNLTVGNSNAHSGMTNVSSYEILGDKKDNYKFSGQQIRVNISKKKIAYDKEIVFYLEWKDYSTNPVVYDFKEEHGLCAGDELQYSYKVNIIRGSSIDHVNFQDKFHIGKYNESGGYWPSRDYELPSSQEYAAQNYDIKWRNVYLYTYTTESFKLSIENTPVYASEPNQIRFTGYVTRGMIEVGDTGYFTDSDKLFTVEKIKLLHNNSVIDANAEKAYILSRVEVTLSGEFSNDILKNCSIFAEKKTFATKNIKARTSGAGRDWTCKYDVYDGKGLVNATLIDEHAISGTTYQWLEFDREVALYENKDSISTNIYSYDAITDGYYDREKYKTNNIYYRETEHSSDTAYTGTCTTCGAVKGAHVEGTYVRNEKTTFKVTRDNVLRQDKIYFKLYINSTMNNTNIWLRCYNKTTDDGKSFTAFEVYYKDSNGEFVKVSKNEQNKYDLTAKTYYIVFTLNQTEGVSESSYQNLYINVGWGA